MIGFLNVIVAAIVGFAIGAGWYMGLAEPWKKHSKVPLGPDGNPENNGSPVPYIGSFICILLVAGMMRHTFQLSGIDTIGKGFVSGLGIGLFFITPWIFLNNLYTMRSLKLGLIDGGYATVACAVMGAVMLLW